LNIKENYIQYGVITLLGGILAYLNRNVHVDDALIYYRYIENFISGNGLVYNIGERFNALTSPLYIYLSILLSTITGEVEITQVILNCFLMITSSLVLLKIFDTFKLKTAGFIIAVIFITSKYFYTVVGMETNLFILMCLLCIYYYLKLKLNALSICFGFLLITRGEGFFLVLILLFLLYRNNKALFHYKYLLIFASIIAANFLFNYYYYGEFLPHTLSVKIGQGQSGLWGKYSYLFGSSYLFGMFNNQAFYILFIFSAAIYGLVSHYRNIVVVILLIFLILLNIFYLSLNIPSYHWYYSIHFLTLFVLCGLGITEVISMTSRKISNKTLRISFLCILFIYPVLTQLEIARLLANEKPHTQYKKIGEWFLHNTEDGTVIAAVEIGHIGWYSKRYIVDILGLTNPLNADFISSGQFTKWYDVYKPDYIISHNPPWPQEVLIHDLISRGEYIEIPVDGVKDYKILKSERKH